MSLEERQRVLVEQVEGRMIALGHLCPAGRPDDAGNYDALAVISVTAFIRELRTSHGFGPTTI